MKKMDTGALRLSGVFLKRPFCESRQKRSQQSYVGENIMEQNCGMWKFL
jgi:hypothetical protein